MNIRCPQCHTQYSVDPEALASARGQARCFHCGSIFNAYQQSDTAPPTSSAQLPADPEAEAAVVQLNKHYEEHLDDLNFDDLAEELSRDKLPQVELDLPFDIPEDLPVLQPSGDAALDLHDTLQPRRRARAPIWQKLLVTLLLITLLLQLAWFYRVPLLRLPQAQPLCQWIDCSIAQQRDPGAFLVLERRLEADPEIPSALRLLLHFRNDAGFAQPLPGLQLALLDSNGVLLARRLFQPGQYLFPAPAGNALAAPQEVFTIELVFEDPGARASSFRIEFL